MAVTSNTRSTFDTLSNTEENRRTLVLLLLKFLRNPTNDRKYPNDLRDVESWAARDAPTNFPPLKRIHNKFESISEFTQTVKFITQTRVINKIMVSRSLIRELRKDPPIPRTTSRRSSSRPKTADSKLLSASKRSKEFSPSLDLDPRGRKLIAEFNQADSTLLTTQREVSSALNRPPVRLWQL